MSAEFVPKRTKLKLEEVEETNSETADYIKTCDDCSPLLYSVKEEIVDYKQEEPSNDIIYKGVSLGEMSGMYPADTVLFDGVKVELCPINNTYDVVNEEQAIIGNDRMDEMIEKILAQAPEISSKHTELISDVELAEDRSASFVEPAEDQSSSMVEVYFEHYTEPGPIKKKSSPPKSCILCVFCDETFQNKGGLKKHISQCHADIRHCALCGTIFATVKVLIDHLHQYHTEKHVKCQICFKVQKKYKTSLLLLEHMIQYHNPYSSASKKPKQCTKRQRQKTESYQCTSCTRRFKTQQIVTHHKRIVHHIIPEEKFADVESYDLAYIKKNRSNCSFTKGQHILGSHIGKDTECKTCPKNSNKCFLHKSGWKRANRVMATKRRLILTKYCYKCRYCNVGSEDREIMKTHLKYAHSEKRQKTAYGKYECGVTPLLKLFHCQICPAVFSQWQGYIQHMKSSFSHQYCEICLRRNAIRNKTKRFNLPLHQDRKHGILLVCPKTIESFDDKQGYENHKLKRHYYCQLCNVVICSLSESQAHKKALHKHMVYDCEHCGKEYLVRSTFSKHKDVCSKLIKSEEI